MNVWDILLILLIAAAFVLAVGKWIRDRRRGGCGCGCGGCTGCDSGRKSGTERRNPVS